MTTVASNALHTRHHSVLINNQFSKRSLHDNFGDFKRFNRESLNGQFHDIKESSDKTLIKDIQSRIGDNHDNKVSTILTQVSPEILLAKAFVNEAIKNKRIFSIIGPYDKLRQVLKARGWVEKKIEDKTNNLNQIKLKCPEKQLQSYVFGDIPSQKVDGKDQESAINKYAGNEGLHEIASQLVQNCVPDFLWSLKMNQIDMKNIKPNQIINHFGKAGSFTTKIGLIKSFNYIRWFEKNPDEIFPRSYIVSDENEKKAFLDDYYLTACLSMVRLITELNDLVLEDSANDKENDFGGDIRDTNNSKCQSKKIKPYINYNEKEFGNSTTKIDRQYPEMALKYCQSYLLNLHNSDLDSREFAQFTNKKWEDFFENFWSVSFDGYGIECTKTIQNKCKQICEEFSKLNCQYNLNGTKNIWILKPGAKSRGRGISCISKFSELATLFRTGPEMLIIQKYIERPLLIYNTKFDIRQWFLVTSWSPLTIWWYNDSYIRFCSQQFTLNDFNEAVHLSNNSIQNKYENGTRSQHLPACNMWYWQDFENYLK